MPKRKIHFIGFLANVDDSILKLKLKDDFEAKKLTQQEAMPFLRKIDFYYGADSRGEILGFGPDGKPSGSYCITKQSVAEFEGTPQGGVVIKVAEVKRGFHALRDNIRLLRLFKEGNIVLRFSCLYHIKDSEPSIVSMFRERPVADSTKFRLEDNEILEAQSFIENTKIPFGQGFIQLAFEAFELSYEVEDRALAFLSLMIGLETMLNRGVHELKYRVSRNMAVLLGQSFKESERIFKDAKELYDKRSKVVHTGERQKIKEEDILKLRGYVREAIKKISTKDKSKDELLDTLNAFGFCGAISRDDR